MATAVVHVDTAGSAGSATGSGQTISLPPCLIIGIKLAYNGSAPGTTDTTVTEVDGLGQTILTRADTATDGTFYPRYTGHDTTGATGSLPECFFVDGPLQVAVAGCDELDDAVVATIQYMESKVIV